MKKRILYIGNKLAKHGLTPSSIDSLGALLEEEYDVIFASDKKNKIIRLIEMVLKVFTNRNSIDIILIDTYSSLNFWYAVVISFLGKQLKIKYLPILHGGNLPSRLTQSPAATAFLLNNAYSIVSPSAYLERIFKEKGFPVTVIPNPINIQNYPFKKREKLLPNVLWVRSFHEIYNPILAIEIFKDILKIYPGAKLGMVGPEKDGSMQVVKKLIEKHDISHSVNLTGRLSKEDWIELSKEYDIFLNTSNFDNQPVTLIEVMALGLPIISSSVGGIPFLINHGMDGILVPSHDANDYVKEIKNLIGDEEKANKICVNGRIKAKRFDWVEIKQKWDAVLNK